ncbi:MAG TPA: ribosome-associated translation inhibitor RaiA [Firmicutes bacterium]|nr:ribosome-associated translation inhibitor RaiA [Bacillota bacterium]
MHIDVKGKNLEITDALREYAEKKAGKLAKFFDNGDLDTEVFLSVQRGMHIAELTLRIGGLVLRGESRTNDMYASIDEACDRIEQQIRKYKTRIQRRLQDIPRKAVLRVQQVEDTHEAAAPRIVRSKRFAMKPMDVEEAVTEMELVGHDFFVFRNAATDSINVVYRRRDGDYGLIEPEY